jgi:hypothetical protein
MGIMEVVGGMGVVVVLKTQQARRNAGLVAGWWWWGGQIIRHLHDLMTRWRRELREMVATFVGGAVEGIILPYLYIK